MYSTAFPAESSPAAEAELRRRAEEQRVRRILEPKDDEARERWYAAKSAQEREYAAAEDRAKTDLYARGLLWSVLATVVLAVVTSIWNAIG